MITKINNYRITLEHLPTEGVEIELNEPLVFEFQNHDEIFTIIERVKAKKTFANDDEATQFVLGLKLFSEVMLKNKRNPLFTELKPAFGEFMKKLKSS